MNNPGKDGVAKWRYPDPLRKLGLTPWMLAIFLVIALLPLFVTSQYTLRLLISALMTAVLGMAFDFTTGYINICNFGYAAFWGLGAYTSAILVNNLGISPWLGMICALFFSGVMGMLIGMLTIRLGGIFASCMCWFVSLALIAIVTNLVDLTNGSAGLRAPALFTGTSNQPYYYTIFIIMILVYMLLRYITNSKAGMAFRAIGLDNECAGSCGINHIKYKLFNFAVSCALAGLVGGFYVHYIGIMTPSAMSNTKTVEIMAISYIGGRGTIWGALISAMSITPILESAKGLMEWRQILYGLIMIVVMIFYPRGFAGIIGRARDFALSALRKRKAREPAGTAEKRGE